MNPPESKPGLPWTTIARSLLPPLCLVALVAVLWALPYRPSCDALAGSSDPAIARVDSECVLLSEYSERLRLIEASVQYAEGEFLRDAPNLDYLRTWYDRVRSYGPDTIALADAVRNTALYQRAVIAGQTPSNEEVAAVRNLDRQRSESSGDYIQLVKLAQAGDEPGFREVLQLSKHPDLVRILEDSSPSDLMASLAEVDWRPLEQALEEGEAYLESIGSERYWQKILPAKLRRDMAVDNLENSVLDSSADGPYAETPRLAWLSYQREVIDEVEIALTIAAPARLSIDRTLEYLADLLEAERRALEDEYRRFQQRREERRR